MANFKTTIAISSFLYFLYNYKYTIKYENMIHNGYFFLLSVIYITENFPKQSTCKFSFLKTALNFMVLWYIIK